MSMQFSRLLPGQAVEPLDAGWFLLDPPACPRRELADGFLALADLRLPAPLLLEDLELEDVGLFLAGLLLIKPWASSSP